MLVITDVDASKFGYMLVITGIVASKSGYVLVFTDKLVGGVIFR